MLLENYHHLLLVGRRAADADRQALIARLGQVGRTVEYVARDMPPTIGLVDLANALAMANAMPTSIEAAACHVGSFEVPPACLEACQAHQIGTPH